MMNRRRRSLGQRIDELERLTDSGGCPVCRRWCGAGVRFGEPPAQAELEAMPPDLRPPPERCPCCGAPATKVLVLPDLAEWAAL
jgi:hypothetical protein